MKRRRIFTQQKLTPTRLSRHNSDGSRFFTPTRNDFLIFFTPDCQAKSELNKFPSTSLTSLPDWHDSLCPMSPPHSLSPSMLPPIGPVNAHQCILRAIMYHLDHSLTRRTTVKSSHGSSRTMSIGSILE